MDEIKEKFLDIPLSVYIDNHRFRQNNNDMGIVYNNFYLQFQFYCTLLQKYDLNHNLCNYEIFYLLHQNKTGRNRNTFDII